MGSIERDSSQRLQSEATALLRTAFRDEHTYENGSMSCAAYDTAWVSLVSKSINGKKQWLFPESFRYLVDHQKEDGSWGGQNSPIDIILNTAAPLLSLKQHATEPLQFANTPEFELIEGMICRAERRLQQELDEWDVAGTVHVGFEVIAPAMLKLLAAEGLCFSFAAHHELMELNLEKLKHFDPEVLLYGSQKSTLLHSLEAFVSTIDFDRVAHQKVGGSFMASPSATAAYLMNVSSWDDEAEDYIRRVIVEGPGSGLGAVPSAYPSSNFEHSWLLSTLLYAGFTALDLQSPELLNIVKGLEQSFMEGEGTIGFARSIDSDADDTAKGLLALNMLGSNVSAEALVKRFELQTHFQTYPSERDPSFSANCNVLLAFLHQKNIDTYQTQIFKCVKFLVRCWWNTDGPIHDKWNRSHFYSSMLMAQALTEFLVALDRHILPRALNAVEMAKVTVCLFQACLRTMLRQETDGSWNHSPEETGYAILTLQQAQRLSFFRHLQSQLKFALDRAVQFISDSGWNLLQKSRDASLEYLWIEKVSYASPLLSTTYCLAALRAASCSTYSNENVAGSLGFEIPSLERVDKYVWLYHQTPLFRSLPDWHLRASFIEGHLFLPIVNKHKLDVFPRKDMDPDDYIELIPFTWTATSNRKLTFASPAWLYAMMMVSVVDYQADEFMEAVAGLTFAGHLEMLVDLIQEVLAPYKAEPTNPLSSLISSRCEQQQISTHMAASEDIENVKTCLSRFAAFFLGHSAVQHAHADDKATAWREVHNYLVAHVRHTQDNIRLNSQDQRRWYVSRNMPYFHWIRSNDDIACPITFGFVTCLVPYLVANPIRQKAVIGGNMDGDIDSGLEANVGIMIPKSDASFDSVEAKYYADDVCRHLTNVTRIYNDCGSIARDSAERNLNSVNFPEFAVTAAESDKLALHALGEYERSCCQNAFASLETVWLNTAESTPQRRQRRRKLDVWQIFIDTADLYGQIYVVRDFTTRSVHVRDAHISSVNVEISSDTNIAANVSNRPLH